MKRRIVADHAPAYSTPGNPYNRLLCDALTEQNVTIREYGLRQTALDPPQILHHHWPEIGLSFRPRYLAWRRILSLLVVARMARRKGCRVIWTAHNLRPHERIYPRFESWFYRQWTDLVDGIICLSDSSRRLLIERYPELEDRPIFVSPHGHYRPVLPRTLSRTEARAEWGWSPEDRVIANVGAIRPYKNIPGLIRVFRGNGESNLRLVVAGTCSDDALRQEIETAASGDSRIRLAFGFLEDSAMQTVITAADVAVLPYSDILNSGFALYALSCNTPVLAPNLGSLPELAAHVGSDWVGLYDGEFRESIFRDGIEALSAGNRAAVAPLEAYEWPLIGQQHRDAYDAVLG